MRAIARKLRKYPVGRLAIAQSAPWAKRFACAIRSTGSSCPGRRVLYAVGRRRIRIISRLCNLVHGVRCQLSLGGAELAQINAVKLVEIESVEVAVRKPEQLQCLGRNRDRNLRT